MNDSIIDLIHQGRAEAAAVAAPGRPSLTYGGLWRQVDDTSRMLAALGVGPGDRVAIVLPNGPEMALAFVAVAASVTTAPLNPAYHEGEFDFYLSDLDPRLLIVPDGERSAAVEVAERRGIAVAGLQVPAGAPSGAFVLEGSAAGPARPVSLASGDDVALVLHTSGTTSRPKLVPLTHRNVCASAAHIAASLALTERDRCLNIMPLFHIHGLMAAVLATLGSGASVYCSPGFNGLRFFSWLQESEATWYTGSPAMHRGIIDRAARNADIVRDAHLRLMRSASAPLRPRLMEMLEETFHAPVIESYGMTEAAHQMTSNPLPPRERRAGTVGVAAGPEVAVADEDGRLLPPGATGEVVIRGPNVTPGYLNNDEANRASFFDGWFRTGDQGTIDADGYLRLTGRLKEIINRGGEKISPREIDEALFDHPAVALALTFAMPHEALGEEVAAAVVLKDGSETSEREIRDFLRRRLAEFKVPRRIVFLDEIPRGATGKLQRIGLAERLGLAGS